MCSIKRVLSTLSSNSGFDLQQLYSNYQYELASNFFSCLMII